MAILRWMIGAALVGFLLLAGLIPRYVPQPGSARAAGAQQAQGSEKKAKRVYTNDDWPFNQPRPASPAPAGSDASQPVVSGSGGEKIAPFVPTPMEIVEKMLEIAEVTAKDVVYDMGSGDGRIVILAAQRFGARAVGIELDHGLAEESTERVKELNLEELVTIVEGDLLQTNVKPATVMTVYLLPSANDRLRPILEKDLRPGTRVVAHDIRIPGWEPSKEETVTVGGGTHYVYLYRIPDAFRK